MTATATLVHTSSRALDNADRIARVAAAGRVQAARIVAERRAAERAAYAREVATSWVEDIRAAGAVKVGFKICDDYGKHRLVATLADAVETLVRHYGEDVEAWGITATDDYVSEVW